jgi:hypothetical protein
MELEDSVPHSQAPATCPYPEPARSIPCPHILLTEDPSYCYPPIYAWVSQVDSFPQVSSPKPCLKLSSPPYVLHASPISRKKILAWIPERKKASSWQALVQLTLQRVFTRNWASDATYIRVVRGAVVCWAVVNAAMKIRDP